MKSIFLTLFLGVLLFSIIPVSQAKEHDLSPEVDRGILPGVSQDVNCKEVMDDFYAESETLKPDEFFANFPRAQKNVLLGCAIKTGRISVWMVPFYITYIIRFLIGLAGLISTLFIVIGGYRMVTGGIAEDKESGKKTLLYAIVGLIVTLLAWIIVNIIQTAVTT